MTTNKINSPVTKIFINLKRIANLNIFVHVNYKHHFNEYVTAFKISDFVIVFEWQIILYKSTNKIWINAVIFDFSFQ